MSATLAALAQPQVLAPCAPLGCALTFRLAPGADPRPALRRLRAGYDLAWGVVGVGDPLAQALVHPVAGLRAFPGLSGPGGTAPSTQQALWVYLGAADRSTLFDRRTQLVDWLADAFVLTDALETFVYAGGRDLTGYEDGTENPQDAKAVAAALVASGAGLAGSSFAAVQRWEHDLARFRAFPAQQRDHTIGRRIKDNAELAKAPPSAHVKRTAQESYDPAAFMVRRSMPWASAHAQGLEFVAYGESLDRFERVLRRMLGLEDGVADALFSFSRALTGSYYWCPPVAKGKLDLRALGV